MMMMGILSGLVIVRLKKSSKYIKHFREKITPHSELLCQENLEIDVSVSIDNEWLYINVDDNGVGVEEHERNLVLERFHRGSNSHSLGSGLGLSLVTQQVEIHSGTVKIMESPKGGARVTIALPVISEMELN